MNIKIQNSTFKLLPERAVLWLEKKTLIVADLHLGKAATFQKAGVAVPEGSMDHDLLRLKTLIQQYEVQDCLIVGDLIHAQAGLTPLIRKKIKLWLKELACAVHLILGNHDRPLIKGLPEEWNLRVSLDQYVMESFCFKHHPNPEEHYFVFAGHLHPQFQLSGPHDSLRLPCFWRQKRQMVLPAFGQFTGGVHIKKSPECEIYLIADQTVIPYQGPRPR